VEGDKTHQVWEGFGATTMSLVHSGEMGDSLGPARRAKVLEAVYGQVGLTMGNISIGLLESPGGWDNRRNDNDDPCQIDWKGFDAAAADNMKKWVTDPAGRMGFVNYSLAGNINWIWSSPWLGELYKKDRPRCLAECAEQVEAAVTYWRKITGSLPPTVHLFNEPTSGNGEVRPADAAMIRDIVKACGRRLRERGFKDIKFVVPNEETVGRSLAVARTILEDADARQYVAAVGYHVYPYGSPYASVPRILKASGAGKADEQSVRQRAELRELCRNYGLPAWMTEVSHAEADPRSMDHLRGRAIHIHDEMVYADAAAFYGMNAFWDAKTHDAHFAGRANAGLLSENDTIVLADNAKESVLITGMGYAIGHYGRWIKRGAVRLQATSSDELVQVTAFRDAAAGRLVLVVINNASAARTLEVAASRLALKDAVAGEQSVAHHYWEKLKEFAPAAADRFQTQLPPLSVTTFAAALAGPGPASSAAK
jgi:O-glycosyl hydrolase